jgi:flagellar biosynthetic protein FlhB
MAEQFGEKTQEATPHRRQKAREQGQVARSQDLTSALLLVGGTVILMFSGPKVVQFFDALAQRQLGGSAWLQADPQVFVNEWSLVTTMLARVLWPVFGLLMLLAAVVNVGQVGILFLPQKLLPELNRVSPAKGFARLFSLSNVVRFGFGLFKVTVVVAVALWCVYAEHTTILSLATRPVDEVAAAVASILLVTCLKIGIALLILAIFDYAYQRWKHEQDLRMTTQEVREELKTLQGDPQVAARRRQVQRELVLHRIQSSVPQADVVVTNPTELAIAIKYDPQEMEAPIVVAKGAGFMAQRIRRLALENGIPVLERKPLAQALFRDVEINQPIPTAQYAAVAEILRYVYQLKGKSLPTPDQAA